MDPIDVLPDIPIKSSGIVAEQFLRLGITGFIDACRYVHRLPYGYNSNRDDLLILFKEEKGSCATKHAVVATLARELALPVVKHIGIYAMTEAIVTGTGEILSQYRLPYVPMLHCFLSFETYRVDLTEGNRNGKNCAIDHFLHTEAVTPHISEKDEYRRYRNVLKEKVLLLEEMSGVDMKHLLQAREKGLVLLKSKLT